MCVVVCVVVSLRVPEKVLEQHYLCVCVCLSVCVCVYACVDGQVDLKCRIPGCVQVIQQFLLNKILQQEISSVDCGGEINDFLCAHGITIIFSLS